MENRNPVAATILIAADARFNWAEARKHLKKGIQGMEIELKLRFPASGIEALKADPLLAGLRGPRPRRKRLDNLYFDTPERELAAARIGLRLRKDGRRWLQTVKSGGSAQSGLHQRDEIEFAVAGRSLEWAPLAATPFAALLEPLKARLQPQFRCAFTRDIRRLRGPGGAEIELAIDQGEIIAGKRREPICELELELKSGDADDLFQIALALADRHPLVLDSRSKAERGDALSRNLPLAPPVKAADLLVSAGADAAAMARLAIENCLAQWQANEPGFLAQTEGSYDSEYLHQLRVAIRRLRVACDPLARLAPWQTEVMADLKKPLQALGRQLGDARDWDVFTEETLPLLLAVLQDAGARIALQEAVDLKRELAHLQARSALESRETQRVLLLLNRCLFRRPDASDDHSSPRTADASFEALHGELDRFEQRLSQGLGELDELQPERLHALRIIAKKMRYLAEFSFGRYDAEATQKWLKWLKKAQDVLGSRNDIATAAARIDWLCKAVPRRHGKIRRPLQAALAERTLPELDLPPLPDRFWR
jgi:triphosphatase